MLRRRTNNHFTYFLVPVVLVVIGFIAVLIWNAAQRSALSSCVYAANGDIVEYSKLVAEFAQTREVWYILNDEEVKKVIDEINLKDCYVSGSQPEDIREKTFRIAVKKISEYGFTVIVWSRGFDNISGTDDDIYGSIGEKPIQ